MIIGTPPRLLQLLVATVLVSSLARGAEPVRELTRAGLDLTLGTPRFRLTVRASGAIAAAQVGDTSLISFISFYTNPVSPQTGKAVRCCQVESPGLGDRPSEVQTDFRDGVATVTIVRDCSHPEVDANAPLWRLRETVEVTPTGQITIRYRGHWLRLSRWSGFSVVTAFTTEAFRGRPLEAYVPGLTLPGVPPKELPDRHLLDGLMGLQLSSSAGPVRQWLGGMHRADIQDWGQYLSVLATPTVLPHSNMTMYRDTEAAFSISLQLPLP